MNDRNVMRSVFSVCHPTERSGAGSPPELSAVEKAADTPLVASPPQDRSGILLQPDGSSSRAPSFGPAPGRSGIPSKGRSGHHHKRGIHRLHKCISASDLSGMAAAHPDVSLQAGRAVLQQPTFRRIPGIGGVEKAPVLGAKVDDEALVIGKRGQRALGRIQDLHLGGRQALERVPGPHVAWGDPRGLELCSQLLSRAGPVLRCRVHKLVRLKRGQRGQRSADVRSVAMGKKQSFEPVQPKKP